MTTYLYSGPFSGVTLPDGQEKLLHDGKEVDLPSGNSWVADLVFRGHLHSVAAIPGPAPAQTLPDAIEQAPPPDALDADPDSMSTRTTKKKGGN